jgi:xanthine dehydrogenase YagR molybdenum-binding subunit
MDFDAPATANPSDRMRVIGQPLDRVDGPLKVSGRAPYSYEYHTEAPDAAYGWMVGAEIGKGKITGIDTAAAEGAPGVLLVLTHRNAPPQGKDSDYAAPPAAGGPEVMHTTRLSPSSWPTASSRRAPPPALVRVDYAGGPGRFDLAQERSRARCPPNDGPAARRDTDTRRFRGRFRRRAGASWTSPTPRPTTARR